MKKVIIITIALICIFPVIIFSEIPHLMNYQGILTDDTGQPVQNDVYEITFKIYNQESGGNPIWTETQNVLTNDGIFHVLLGSINEITEFPSENAWLGIQVGENPEMTPRKRIASVGYSFETKNAVNAINADNASYADEANHANTSSDSDALQGYSADDFVLNSDYVEPISIGLDATTFNMAQGGVWYEIRELTITISSQMNLHCLGFFRRGTATGYVAAQFQLKNNQNQVIDSGARSFRNPSGFESFVATDITFSVNAGTYKVVLNGGTQDPGSIEDVYISLIGLPQTNTEDYSSNVPSIHQETHPYLSKPFSDK